MKRTKTKYGPDAKLQNLLDQWFITKKFNGRNGMTDHWVCTRCPGDDPVHQSLCTSQGTRKRAHILGGQFAQIHRIRVCQGIDKQERKELIKLYKQCSRNSKKFKFQDYSDDSDEDNDDSDDEKKINKKRKKNKKNLLVSDISENDDDDDEFNNKQRKKRKGRKDYHEESSDEEDEQNQKIDEIFRKQNGKYINKQKKKNRLNGTYQVPVKEVSDPATDFQKFRIMLGFYVYLLATKPSDKKTGG